MKLKYFWGLIGISILGLGLLVVIPMIKNNTINKKQFNIGICCGEPPYEFLNKDGQVEGIIKDLMEEVFKNNQLKKRGFRWSIMPFNQSFIALNKGRIDFLATFLVITKEREKLYDFAVISNSSIVFVHRINMENNILYGLQSESLSEKLAKEKKIKYMTYPDNQSVIFNFNLKKIHGIVCDKKILKDLIEKDFPEITHYTNINNMNIEFSNDGLIITNPEIQNDIIGTTKGSDTKKIYNKNLRVYYNLKDLLLDFRTNEIKTIILKKSELNNIFNHFHGLKIQFNSSNLNFKPYLNIKYINNYWIIEKQFNKVNNIIGTLKNNSIDHKGSIKFYNDKDILINDLMEDKIDCIAIKNFNEIPMEIFCSFANTKNNLKTSVENGLAFRKKILNKFDEKKKDLLIKIIEETAKNNKDLYEFEDSSKNHSDN